MTSLHDDVRALVSRAQTAYAGTGTAPILAEVRSRLEAPLRLAIAGRVKAGKSTLLNALVGEQLAPTDAGECTKIVTWYQHGHTYRVRLDLSDGSSVPARFTRTHGAIDVELGTRRPEDIERMVVEWPSPRLADVTLIDTPGIASVNTDVSARTMEFLSPGDDAPTDADAVLYLMRHLHSADLSFLESFHDDELAHASPVNAIGVISRADEMGVGRPDAMRVAHRVARRYRHDPQIMRLCQTVLPVGGLLAETAASLTEDEYRALASVASLERGETDALLLSADRFTSGETLAGLTPLERRHLLDRFGMFGVRIALPLIRHGRTRSGRELAAALQQRSGIDELRGELLGRFGARSDVLRSRSALRTVAAVIADDRSDGSEALAAEVERIEASAHAFAEIRLLNAFRQGTVAFHDEETAEVDRLLGSAGVSDRERLALPTGATVAEVRSALLATIDRWRRRQENPLTNRDVAEAAGILIRTCEGLLMELPDARGVASLA